MLKRLKPSVVFPFLSFSLTPKTYCVNVEIYECQRKTLLLWITRSQVIGTIFITE